MKHEHTHTHGRRLSRRWRTALRTALVAASLCFAVVITPAFGDQRKSDGSPSYSGGDETIGTLPILHGQQTIDLWRDLSIVQPSLCLEGDLNEILSSIVLMRGQAVAQVVPAGPGRVRVIFPGNVQLGFDRLMIESSSIRVGVWTPANARQSMVAATFTEMPILALSASGSLSRAAFQAHVRGLLGTTLVSASTDPDFLYLRQTH
jgi:hypothetical protein